MNQQIEKSRGLKLKPLALGLALVLTAGMAQADAPVYSMQRNHERLQQRHEQIRERFHRSPAFIQKIAASAKTRDPAVIDQILAEHKAKWQARSANPRPAATITVSNCADSGAGSLRDAVGSAVDGDTIDLSALTCSTITLTSGVIDIEVNHLTITGPGSAALTIDGNASDSILNLYGDYDTNEGDAILAASGVTLTNGAFEGTAGGAVWAYGNLDLDDVVVSNSHTTGNLAGPGGGGIQASGNVVLRDSTVSGNSADSDKYGGYGGGVNAGGDLTLVGSTISGNTAKANGSYTYYYEGEMKYYFGFGLGGGAAAAGNITITNSTISGNDAAIGGALFAGGGEDVTLRNSTITGNEASLDNMSWPIGSGYELAEGGGVAGWFPNGVDAVLNSTIISGNTGNTSNLYGEDLGLNADEDEGYAVTLTGAKNLIIESSNTLPADTLTADPMLGPLANNGGLTMTHALLAGSPAINAGNNVAALATDQRGGTFLRAVGAAADIGAFEVQTGGPGPGPGPADPVVRNVPVASHWVLGMLALLLGVFGWRRTER